MTTLLQLARTNSFFQEWTVAHLHALPAQMMKSLHAGDQFRKFLTKDEEALMDKFLLDGGPEPAWVTVCREAQNPGQKIMVEVVKITTGSGMTVMCDDCGCVQTMGTKCFTSGNYHM